MPASDSFRSDVGKVVENLNPPQLHCVVDRAVEKEDKRVRCIFVLLELFTQRELSKRGMSNLKVNICTVVAFILKVLDISPRSIFLLHFMGFLYIAKWCVVSRRHKFFFEAALYEVRAFHLSIAFADSLSLSNWVSFEAGVHNMRQLEILNNAELNT